MLKKLKILRSAERYVMDRKFAHAVHQYQRLIAEEPEDPSLLNTVGELMLRQGSHEKALEYFHKVADIYVGGGYTLKAIAMLRKILRHDPSDLRSREQLAELYEKQGLNYDACRELRCLVDEKTKADKPEQALLHLKKISTLDSGDCDALLESAGLLQQTDQQEAAIGCFLEALERLQQKGDFQAAFETATRALEVKTDSRELLQAYVESAEKTSKLSEAESFLAGQLQTTGQEFPYQLFVAQIAEKKGDLAKAGKLYVDLQDKGHYDSLIAEGLVRTGWVENQGLHEAEVNNHFPQIEDTPDDEDGQPGEATGTIDLQSDAPSGDEAAPESSGLFVLDSQEETDGVFTLDEQAEDAFLPTEEPTREPVDLPADEPAIASLDEALEEVDFYLKLGFGEDARRLLERMLRAFPDDSRVLRRAQQVVPSDRIEASARMAEDAAPANVEEVETADNFETEIESALDGLFTGTEVERQEELPQFDLTPADEEIRNTPEVQYDRGLAYKEMGLFDDAVQEFLQAVEALEDSQDPKQRIVCCSMLANSYLQLANYDQAIFWAREGLQSPMARDFEWKALQYDLAFALENRGDTSRALQAYREILQADEEYRDVAQRVGELRTLVNDQ